MTWRASHYPAGARLVGDGGIGVGARLAAPIAGKPGSYS